MIVVRVLRKLAQTGRAIICTIHQPSKEIFSVFDSLLLLKKGASPRACVFVFLCVCGALTRTKQKGEGAEAFPSALQTI
jgi:hypothetical protein